MNDDREIVFSRIREALALKGDSPAEHVGADRYRELLPEVGESYDDRLALFRQWLEELSAEFFTCDESELPGCLKKLRESHGWESAAYHGEGLAKRAIDTLEFGDVLKTDGGYDPEKLEACDVSFTECDALIAQTGSVLLTSRSSGGRAISVLPPHHVILATPDQMVPDLLAAMALVRERYGDDLPSLVTLHTGPSRTGDIERTIVLGAHGPKKLTVIVVGS